MKEPIPPLLLDGQRLDLVENITVLGVNIHKNLSWLPHVNQVVLKCRKATSVIHRVRDHGGSTELLLNLYNSLVKPHIEYCNIIWGSGPISRLQITQNDALRSFNRFPRFASGSALRRKYSVLSVAEIHVLHCAVFAYALVKSHFRDDLSFPVTYQNKKRELRTGDSIEISTPSMTLRQNTPHIKVLLFGRGRSGVSYVTKNIRHLKNLSWRISGQGNWINLT